MTDRKKELGEQKVGRLLISYSTPAMFAMLVQASYNVVDTIFVGRGPGTLALAGLAISFPIQMIILGIGQTVGIGSASIVSRSLGAGDQRRAERTAGTSFATAGALSILTAVSGLVFLRPLLRLFGATDAVLPYAAEYLSVILLGSFFFGFSVSSNNVARSEGNVKIAMTSMIIGACVNVALDPVFIFGLNMGVRGAAVATVIANVCTFTFLCWYFRSGKSLLHIRAADLRPDFSVLPEVFRIGGSSFVRIVAGSFMAIVINNSIAHYGADVHLAFLGVANRVLMFFFMPIFGLVQGLQPIVGFNYGAQNMRRVNRAIGMATLFATALSTGAFLVLMIGAPHVLAIFSKDARLIAEGSVIFRIIIICIPTIGFQMIGGSLFQALGKALPAFILTLARQILVLIPLVLILPRIFGLTGIWMAFPVADGASAVLTAWWVIAEVRALSRHRPGPPVTDEPALEQSGAVS